MPLISNIIVLRVLFPDGRNPFKLRTPAHFIYYGSSALNYQEKNLFSVYRV